MEAFEYNANPGRVIFGAGTSETLPVELGKLGLKSPFLVCTQNRMDQINRLTKILQGSSIKLAGVYARAVMHTPSHITADAVAILKESAADCIVSIGGGSPIGLGKALSTQTSLAHICIPTTYSGSEMTPILGETHDGRKITRSDPRALPGTVIYDVDLTMSLPPGLSVTSGINAMAHAIESLYATNTNPVVRMFALEGIGSLAKSLPIISGYPQREEARKQAQYGAWLCGITLGSSTMALHHKLCHTLGGSFNLPHAETHTIVLPHALSYNAPAIPNAMADLASVLPDSNGDAVQGLNALLDKVQAKRALKDFGMKEEDIDKATEIAMRAQYPNPRALDKSKIREVIYRCWAGQRARADI